MRSGHLKRGSEGLAGEIRTAIGAGPNDEVSIGLPQFERPASWPSVASPPADRAAFDALALLERDALLAVGLVPWDDNPEKTQTLWLYPGAWYHAIPAGLPIVTITWTDAVFVPGETDDDIRYGALAFGVIGALNRKGGG